MPHKIIYRHWQPGDDDAILELLAAGPFNVSRNYYDKKFNDGYLEPEGVRLALANDRVVGHVFGSETYMYLEGKPQDFGMVTVMYVAPDMRRQGIATRLMEELSPYLERKGYRGSILDTNTRDAYRLYQKVGYQEVTRDLQTELSPRSNPSHLKWTEVNPEDFEVLHQIKKRWASQNFPVYWNPEYPEVHVYNMKQYRVLRREGSLVGYAKWDEPSKYHPRGLVRDPMVPDEDPMAVIASVQAAIPAPRAWTTTEGSRYENLLRSLGCMLRPTEKVEMLLSFGPEIDWGGLPRTRPFW